jgi:SOS-response transcriptional repressor LexA
METLGKFGETLNRLVEEKFGKRQQVHAAAALGVSAPQLSRFISGKTVPETATMQKLADGLGVTLPELLGIAPVKGKPKAVIAPYELPVFGSTAAGRPLDSEGDPDGRLRVDRLYPNGSFAMRVQGASMVDHLIGDGDYVIVRPFDDRADAGEKVVVWRRNEGYTLKVLGTARRIKVGKKLEDLGADGRIIGVLVGVIRKY